MPASTRPLRRKSTVVSLFAAVLLVLAGALVASPASAATPEAALPNVASPQASSLTPAERVKAYKDAASSSYPRVSSSVGASTDVTFTLPHGVQMVFEFASPVVVPAVGTLTVHPDVSVGGQIPYLWIQLDRTDQATLAAGGAAALAIAICAIPVVGWAVCAVVAGLLAAAAIYIGANGFCPKYLRIYTNYRFVCTTRTS
jgi:hypothetical protein